MLVYVSNENACVCVREFICDAMVQDLLQQLIVVTLTKWQQLTWQAIINDAASDMDEMKNLKENH